jgi:uncharacterized lipoprotein YddW (UPF0748 family)
LDRRTFLKLAGAGSLALGSLGKGEGLAVAGPATKLKHWAWTHSRSQESVADQQRGFAEIRAAGISSVLLGGATEEACRLAAGEGLEVHAWTWTLCRGGEELLNEHPEWYVVSREGKSACDHPPYVGYYHFLCPSRPEVRHYLKEEVARIAATPRLQGVHLDYIRYPDVILPRALWEKYDLVQNEELPPFDFCYCEVCREQYRALSGTDPLELPDPPADPAWRRFRWDSVTRLVNELVDEIHEHGKLATAAVFPSPAIARRLVRQDWPAWNLDAVLPMVYHSFYNESVGWIEPTVAEGVQALPAGRPLYAGLYLPELKTEEEFEQAVAAALEGGARGVALFGGLRQVGR